MKKIILSVMFIYTAAFADFDRDAYNNYKKTKQYQIAASKPQKDAFYNMHAEYSKDGKKLNWGLTLHKIEDLTGLWADVGAIAKANHENFMYVTLTPVLKNYRGNVVYTGKPVRSEIMFGKKIKLNVSSSIPPNINFQTVTIKFDIITDNTKDKRFLEKPEKVNNKITEEERQAKKQRMEKYKKEVKSLNESEEIKKLLAELKNDEQKKKNEQIRKLSSQEACLGYLKAMDEILQRDDERIKPTEFGTIESLKSTKQSLIAVQKAKVYADKYSKYNCSRFANAAPTETTNKSETKYSSIIMSDCQKKWGTDYSMVKYCVNKQTNAYHSLTALPNDVIMSNCKNKWGTDYSMVKYCVDKQTNAKRSLGL